MKKLKRSSFVIHDEEKRLLKILAQLANKSEAEIIRWLIRRGASSAHVPGAPDPGPFPYAARPQNSPLTEKQNAPGTH